MRRRLAAKKRKLKVAGKSKSTDTEDESTFDYCEDDGTNNEPHLCCINVSIRHTLIFHAFKSTAPEFSRHNKRQREGNFWMAEKRFRFRVRRIVKTQWFYWFVIVLVFLNTVTTALEHNGQPQWLTDFLCEFTGIQ